MIEVLRGFDRLLDAKRRRIGKCEAAVVQERRALEASEAQHRQLLEQEQACRADEAGCAAEIDALADRDPGFLPSEFVTRRHVLETLADRTRKAARDTAAAAQQVQAAQQSLAAAIARLRRAEQQLEQLKQRRDALARRLEQDQEDAQDEESEETAVARLVAARRATEAALPAA